MLKYVDPDSVTFLNRLLSSAYVAIPSRVRYICVIVYPCIDVSLG